MPFQNVSVGVAMLLEMKYKPTLQANQLMFTTHACLQQYFLLDCTMYMFLSFIDASTDRGLNLIVCSIINATTNPTAKIKNVKLKKLDV